MGLKKAFLADLLHQHSIKVDDRPDVGFNWKQIKDNYLYKISEEVYKDLGGMDTMEAVFPEVWDLQIDKIAIVLDSSLSFNRYRSSVLRSQFYESVKSFSVQDYKRFCRTYESDCLKAGMATGIWTNKESEKHFGKASEQGEYFGNGASGWKMRAFKEFLQDIFAIAMNLQLIRIAPYENLMVNKQLIRLDKMNDQKHPEKDKVLMSFIKRKLELNGMVNQTENP